MKRKLPVYMVFSLFSLLLLTIQSCKTGEGCGLKRNTEPKSTMMATLAANGASQISSKKQKKANGKGLKSSIVFSLQENYS
ncbi:MAG: hypothetical protein IPN29_00390 [Saprospiraceae bacterium]|nr:hypothetical protein [Saprospiraceae bacterium]